MKKILIIIISLGFTLGICAQRNSVKIRKSTTVAQVFSRANVGKRVYADRVNMEMNDYGYVFPGPITKAMWECLPGMEMAMGSNWYVNGTIQKNYKGKANTLYCKGGFSLSPVDIRLTFVYDLNKKKLSCVFDSLRDGCIMVDPDHSSASVYQKPNASSQKLTTMSSEDTAKLIDITNNWCKIQTKGVTGYVSKDKVWITTP